MSSSSGRSSSGRSLVGRSLFGRDTDLRTLRAFVDSTRDHGGALLLTGDAGVGKSAVLDAVAEYASDSGLRVLRATGEQFEVSISFAGLHHLLFPLLGQIDRLDAGSRTVLGNAFGTGGHLPADRLAVSHAALALLVAAGVTTPLLIVVDDLPWLDPVSVMVLGFLARRVTGHRIGIVATFRSDEDARIDRAGWRTHDLPPLSNVAALALLEDRFPALTPRVRRRLLTEAQGNPLALLELPIALRSTTPASATTLPLTHRLQSVFAARIGELPTPTRRALLLAVLDGTGDLSIMENVDDLAPAVRAHLVTTDLPAARLSFRHPLIRSAVVGFATDAERRAAHRLLAERRAGSPERRAWHLAEAATGPDEAVAALLQQVAHTNLIRGDSVGAITELLRAADLSPAGANRGVRLGEAAYLGAIVTGDLRDVPSLLDAARRADPDQGGSLTGAVAGAYHLLNEAGDVDNAHRLLISAIEALPDPRDGHNKTLIEALYTLLMVAFFGGRTELWSPVHVAIERLRPRPPRLLSLLGNTFSDPARLALPHLDRLDEAIASLRNETSPARIVRTAIAGSYLDRIGACREPLWRAVRHGRDGGAITSAIEALFLLANDAYFTGRWDEVHALTAEGLDLCDAHDYLLLRWPALYLQALVAAARGDDATSQDLTRMMSRWAGPRRAGAVSTYAWHVRTLTALSRGDFEEAYRCAGTVSPAGQLASHVPNALWLIMELVEAAARTGRIEEATAHVRAARNARIGELSPRLALTLAGAEAMAAPDDAYPRLFERALSMPGTERWPFDLARIHLAYGERLRRTKSPATARAHLMSASDLFEQLEARPWVARAGNELRAAGAHRDRPADAQALTPQQRQIAELAATGLSNKQIGERLFLSSRTVGYHLYQIFPKLGVTSRAALRDALADRPDTA